MTHPAPDDAGLSSRSARVIWLLVVATFVVFLNETTMNVALREIMTSLHVDAITGQWLSTAFMLTMAVVIPVTGYLIQRLHTRTLYVTAMTLFTVGTAGAALAPVFSVLLVARVVQACGTAIMLPLLMTTLMTLVPESRRGRMMGNVSTVISVAPAAGPMVAGVLLSLGGWRGIFWFMLPIAVVMLSYGARTITNVTEPRPVPVDVLSVVLSAVGFGGLVYGLSRLGAGPAGGGLPVVLGCVGAGALALLAFVLRQLRLQRDDRALLDLRTFTHPQFSIGLAIMATLMGALFGVVILLPIYLQSVLQIPPITVGLLLLPGGLVMGVLGQVVGRLYDRFGPRVLAVPGAVVASAVLAGMSLLDERTSMWWVLAAHVTLSVALAFVFTPLFTSTLAAVPGSLYSHASAAIGTLQQVAGAAGTAVFVTIMSARAATLAENGADGASATAGGIELAFLAGALLSLVPLVLTLAVRRPDAVEPAPGMEAGSPADGGADHRPGTVEGPDGPTVRAGRR